MRDSRLKTVLIYAVLGIVAGVILVLWNIRREMELLPTQPVATNAVVALHPPISLSESKPDVAAELVQKVQGQLDAIRAGDYAKARRFAVKGIQEGFTFKDFEQMVRRDYPMIAGWKSVRFGPSIDNGSDGIMRVFIQGPDGPETEFQYSFQREDNTWKIAGVTARPAVRPRRDGTL